MNKGARVRFVGKEVPHYLTKGKIYTIVAGQGDGVPRNDGTLGAYIKDDKTFVIEDDFRSFHIRVFNDRNWKLVEDAQSNYVAKEFKSPIPLSHSLC